MRDSDRRHRAAPGETIDVTTPDALHPVTIYASEGGDGSQFLCDIHKPFEIGIVTVGVFELLDDFRTVRLREGQVWLAGMWEAHRLRVAKEGAGSVVFWFLPETLEETFAPNQTWMGMFAVPPTERPQAVTAESRRLLVSIANEARQEARDQRLAWDAVVRHNLVRILVELLRNCGGAVEPAPLAEISVAAFRRIRPAIELIRPGLGRRISVSEAAAACSLSVPRFHVNFKRAMGASFAAFALRARVGFVAHALAATAVPVDDIAREEGFADGSHLHRSFVRYWGCSPGEYRGRRHDLHYLRSPIEHTLMPRVVIPSSPATTNKRR
jgi:AraC-like DNA-binding protein